MSGSTLTQLQSSTLRIKMRGVFEKWQGERLKVRENLLKSLLAATSWEAAQMRQLAIRDIDAEIQRAYYWLIKMLEVVGETEEQTDVKAD